MSRSHAITAFLDKTRWGKSPLEWLPGDASFRRYARLHDGKQTCLLMDCPPEYERIDSYLTVAAYLRAGGLSAPEIFDTDPRSGLALIEDFGPDTYTALLKAGREPLALYSLAVECLIALHKYSSSLSPAPPENASFALYDAAELTREHRLLPDWYGPVTGKSLSDTAKEEYLMLWQSLLAKIPPTDTVLVLRDFHVDNLIYLKERSGVRACGLLDFQDARIGPRPYDLVSLLQDARRDIDPDLATNMTARYLAAFPDQDEAAFTTISMILGAHRHCKVLGIFARLAKRDNKPSYLRHIPRIWRMLDTCLKHPVLAELRLWFEANLPPALNPPSLR